MQRFQRIIRRFTTTETFDYGSVLFGMFRIEHHHSFGIKRSASFACTAGTAHPSPQYIKQHINSTDRLIIRLAHKFAQKL